MKKNTKEQIVEKALQLFNKNGIEYVGMRELAAELNLRIGNITYYFPTKDDLVYRLSQDLSALNSKIIVENKDLSINGFINLIGKIFNNQLEYSCLYISYVHITQQNTKLRKKNRKTANDRIKQWENRLWALQKNKYLNFNGKYEIKFLASTIGLVGRFWISDAKIKNSFFKPEKLKQNYLEMMARLLLPYCTRKGKKEIADFIIRNKS